MMKRKLLSFIFILCLLLTGCGSGTTTSSQGGEQVFNTANEVAVITLEDGRRMNVELFRDLAPVTVENFVTLAKSGFYEGLLFHRVIEDFMIQGGGFRLDGNTLYERGGASEIYGEFASNGHSANLSLSHQPGVISMARTSIPNSATSQFFICVGDASHLDGDYAAFGKTIDEESLKVAIAISKVRKVNLSSMGQVFPKDPIIIKSIEIVEPTVSE